MDIPLLTYAIFKTLKKKHNLSVSYIGPKAIDRLIDYSWPGNVRELENTLERALLICNNKYLTEEDLGSVLDEKQMTIDSDKETLDKETAQEIATNETATGTQPQEIPITTKVATLKEIEMETIKLSVERNKWNMTTTAEELGISRMTLYRKLEKYGLRDKD